MNENRFSDRLMRGERVLWSGSPGQGILFTGRDIFLIPFSIMWCGFAIFWTFSATNIAAPGFFTAWGMMFVVIGLYFVFGRFLVDAWLRRAMAYAVTDRRILIARGGLFARFTALGLDRLPELELRERANRRGTIRFGQAVSSWNNRNMGGWSPAMDPTPQFIDIEDARSVFDLIQRTSGSERT